jgi:hypothetical protein
VLGSSSPVRRLGASLAAVSTALMVVLLGSPAQANVAIKVVSQDAFTNLDSGVYHATEVEPDTFSHGATTVSIFQIGRYQDGGASAIGWATSTNNGRSWTNGVLPKLTVNSSPPGPYQRSTDPSVAYDAKHGQWLMGTLDSKSSPFVGTAITVSRSTDGLIWGNPVSVAKASGGSNFDSTWVACDDTPTSPHYGTCYFTWDDFGQGAPLKIATSADGGLTWTPVASVPSASVIGSKAVPQPNGNVVVVADTNPISAAESFTSHDGGATFKGPFTIASLQQHAPAGSLRGLDVPSADVDAAGNVYVSWYDCRFRSGCSSNDIVTSISSDGKTWSAPARVPIDGTTSNVDHVLPGIAVQPGTSGPTARIALVYYFLPQANCSSNCQLAYGFIESTDGGSTWSTATQVAGPISYASLPFTFSGYMVGDYTSASFARSRVLTVFTVAKPGSTCTIETLGACNESMATLKTPFAAVGPFHPAGADPVLFHGRSPTTGGLATTQ